MYQDIRLDSSKDCINMSAFELLTYTNAIGIYGSMVSKFVPNGSPDLSELKRQCIGIITKKIKMTTQLREILNIAVDEMFYLNYHVNAIPAYLMKQNMSYEDSLNISQEIEKKVKTMAYKVFDKHREEICAEIDEMNKKDGDGDRYRQEYILKSLTERNLLPIYDGRNEHFLKMTYKVVHDNLTYIDRHYISNMGAHVIQLYDKLDNVTHGSLLSLSIVKIGSRYLNMFELKNEEDIKRAVNFFYYKLPIMETDIVDIVRKYNVDMIDSDMVSKVDFYGDLLKKAKLTLPSLEKKN